MSSVHNYTGFFDVDGLQKYPEMTLSVKFYMKNLKLRSMPHKGRMLPAFGLGLSLANQFSAYSLENEEDTNER